MTDIREIQLRVADAVVDERANDSGGELRGVDGVGIGVGDVGVGVDECLERVALSCIGAVEVEAGDNVIAVARGVGEAVEDTRAGLRDKPGDGNVGRGQIDLDAVGRVIRAGRGCVCASDIGAERITTRGVRVSDTDACAAADECDPVHEPVGDVGRCEGVIAHDVARDAAVGVVRCCVGVVIDAAEVVGDAVDKAGRVLAAPAAGVEVGDAVARAHGGVLDDEVVAVLSGTDRRAGIGELLVVRVDAARNAVSVEVDKVVRRGRRDKEVLEQRSA